MEENKSPYELKEAEFPDCYNQCMAMNGSCCTIYCPEKVKKDFYRQIKIVIGWPVGIYFTLWLIQFLIPIIKGLLK